MKTFKVLRNTRWLSFTVILVAALSSFWALTRAAPEPVMLDGAEAESQFREAALYDSLPEAVAAARYTVQGDAQKGVYEAVNEAQGFRAEFTAEGAQLFGADQITYDPPTWDWQTIKRLPEMKRAPAWQTTLKFVGYGYGETLTAVKGASVSANGSRVEIGQTANQNTVITEWFDNRPDGLEQGWRINAPPAGSSNGQPLRLVLALNGDLTARAEADGSAVNLCDQTGAPVLRYAGLNVTDAKGRRLTARLRGEKQSLSLEIDDNGAAYPLAVDPTFTQAKKLTAATGVAARSFGAAVAIDGSTALIGAPGEQTVSGATVRLGAAYIFINNNGRWEQQARLEATDGSNFDTFGSAVAVQGDTAVVGSQGSRGPGGEVARGAVYIFVRHLINVRFRDTDGAGTAARVQLTLYRHEIDVGSGTTALFTFDSNNFPATGNGDLTIQLTDCAAGTNFDLDFRRYVYWVEAVITRNNTAQQAGFSGMQLTETETPCP